MIVLEISRLMCPTDEYAIKALRSVWRRQIRAVIIVPQRAVL